MHLYTQPGMFILQGPLTIVVSVKLCTSSDSRDSSERRLVLPCLDVSGTRFVQLGKTHPCVNISDTRLVQVGKTYLLWIYQVPVLFKWARHILWPILARMWPMLAGMWPMLAGMWLGCGQCWLGCGQCWLGCGQCWLGCG